MDRGLEIVGLVRIPEQIYGYLRSTQRRQALLERQEAAPLLPMHLHQARHLRLVIAPVDGNVGPLFRCRTPRAQVTPMLRQRIWAPVIEHRVLIQVVFDVVDIARRRKERAPERDDLFRLPPGPAPSCDDNSLTIDQSLRLECIQATLYMCGKALIFLPRIHELAYPRR